MKREFFLKPAIPEIIDFLFTNPVFFIALFASCILFIITAALAFGGLSEVWEKRCGRMLLFTIVPVCLWIVYFFVPTFSPLPWTIGIWLVLVWILNSRKMKDKKWEKKLLVSTGGWRCPECKTINERVYIKCKRCNKPNPKKQP